MKDKKLLWEESKKILFNHIEIMPKDWQLDTVEWLSTHNVFDYERIISQEKVVDMVWESFLAGEARISNLKDSISLLFKLYLYAYAERKISELIHQPELI